MLKLEDLEDLNVEQDEAQEMENKIDEGAQMIQDRYNSLEEIKRILKSNKMQAEEDR
jgi:hypothetical protein